MARDPDDEALSWGDENDPTYVAAHPAALDEDDLEQDVPVVDAFSSSAVAAPLPPAVELDKPTAPARTPAATPTVEQRADAAEDAAVERDLAEAERDAEPLSSLALITFGVFGGIFLLYTVGWLVTFIRNPTDPSGLAGIVQNAQNVLAIAAPALWFIVTLLVGAKRRVPVRLVWLVIGIVVLVPWPFLTGY